MTDPDLDKLIKPPEGLEEHFKDLEEFAKLSKRLNNHPDSTIKKSLARSIHFIYELIQNADDAQATKIRFDIKHEEIRVSHNGRDFSVEDVKSITVFNNSTKKDEESKIGKYGIGFKSVFNITTKPKIHSGEFNFEIGDDMRVRILESQKNNGTIFVLPLDKETPASEIIEKINQFAPESLLFLSHVKEIKFSLAGKDQTYRVKELPSSRKSISSQDDETTYLFFKEGKVKIAYQIEGEEGKEKIASKESAKIFVFFPADKESAHFEFLAHVPYQTAPSRETIYFEEEENQTLTQSLAELFCQSLETIEQEGFLTAEFFDLLPLEGHPDNHHPAAVIYEKFLEEIQNKPLLPKHGGGYVKAGEARLGSEELRKLFTPTQLGAIHGQDKIEWISGSRTPKLYSFLKKIGVQELDWGDVLPKLTKDFLEKQKDDWIRELYEALNDQSALRYKMSDVPLIRLEAGEHIELDKEKIFLPLKGKDTQFLTVRRAVCNTDNSQKFLKDLGMRLPERVDDVIKNILPTYTSSDNNISESDYKKDISDILDAHATDSIDLKKELAEALADKYFIKAINADGDAEKMAKPQDVYMHTDSLTKLFSGVKDIFFVNNSYLKGVDAQSLLRACNVAQYLRPVEKEARERFSYEELWKMREGRGSSQPEEVIDYMIPGLEDILKKSPSEKGSSLWKALSDYIKQPGESRFFGRYTWTYYRTSYKSEFPAIFLNQLKESAWIPDKEGKLQKPEVVTFSSTGWQPENDELAKLLGMIPETIPVELYQEQVAENAKLRAEIAELKEERESPHARQDQETSPQSQNRERVDPDKVKLQIFEGEPHNPQKNITSQSRTSASSNSSSTTQRDDDDIEQRSFPEESKEIGKEGERVVCGVLRAKYGPDNVVWHNEKGESMKSHDFTIKGEQGDIFVEVKSTKEESLPHRFDFSEKQFQEMEDNSENYIIYAVFGYGTETRKIKEIKSPSGQLTPAPRKYVLEITEWGLLRSESFGGALRSADEATGQFAGR